MSDTGHCCACDTRQAFLDGYRHGLGQAVIAVDATRHRITHDMTEQALSDALSTLSAPPHSPRTAIGIALRGVANGLRALSASLTLADGPER